MMMMMMANDEGVRACVRLRAHALSAFAPPFAPPDEPSNDLDLETLRCLEGACGARADATRRAPQPAVRI